MQMLLECEPVDFATLVHEAAERSAQFSAKLVEQVLDARHAVIQFRFQIKRSSFSVHMCLFR
jgi:hypothetical protein